MRVNSKQYLQVVSFAEKHRAPPPAACAASGGAYSNREKHKPIYRHIVQLRAVYATAKKKKKSPATFVTGLREGEQLVSAVAAAYSGQARRKGQRQCKRPG